MALINCPECNARISDKALTCPQCGHPMREIGPHKVHLPRSFNIGWIAVAVIMLILLLFLLLDSCKWAPVV